MTSWQLREDWSSIAYALEYSGSAFEVSLNGSIVTVVGADRAVPGVEEEALVSVTSHPAVAPVRLILRVGAAPSTLPQGRVGHPAVLAGGRVVVHDLRDRRRAARSTRCRARRSRWWTRVPPERASESASRSPRRRRSWPRGTATLPGRPAPPRSPCRTRRAGAERRARRSAPPRPAGLPQGARQRLSDRFSDGELTLRVDPGEAAPRLPRPDRVRHPLERVRRSRSARRTAVPADRGAQRRAAHLRGVRAQRRRAPRARACVLVAWAYDSPAAPSAVQARPVVTAGEGGVVSLTIDGIDTEKTGALEITSPAGETVRVPVGRDETQHRAARVPRRHRTLQPDHGHSVLALRPAARAGGARPARPRPSGATASVRRPRRRARLSRRRTATARRR